MSATLLALALLASAAPASAQCRPSRPTEAQLADMGSAADGRIRLAADPRTIYVRWEEGYVRCRVVISRLEASVNFVIGEVHDLSTDAGSVTLVELAYAAVDRADDGRYRGVTTRAQILLDDAGNQLLQTRSTPERELSYEVMRPARWPGGRVIVRTGELFLRRGSTDRAIRIRGGRVRYLQVSLPTPT